MPSYDVLNNLINGVAPTIWQKRSTNRRRSTRTSFPKASLSIGCGEKTGGQLGPIIREHWRVKNLNHWKRDTTDWREDGPLKRNPKEANNLDLLGNALLAVILFERFDSLNDAVDYYRDNRSKSLGFMKTEPPLSRIAQLSNRAGPRKRTFSFS